MEDLFSLIHRTIQSSFPIYGHENFVSRMFLVIEIVELNTLKEEKHGNLAKDLHIL